MTHSPLGFVHLAAAIAALASGAWVFFLPKGGKRHKAVGFVYVFAMLVVVVTAFSIYRLTRSVNFLHVAAFISGLTVGKGMWHVIRRKPNKLWFDQHVNCMIWSYVGLVAALIAETATRVGMPMLRGMGVKSFGWFWAIVGLVTFLVICVSLFLIRKNQAALERYRR